MANDHASRPTGADDEQQLRRSLAQLNVRLPNADRAALKELASRGGVSLNALLGAILGSFVSDHSEQALAPLLARARTIDATRRSRPHLRSGTNRSDDR